MFLRSLFTLLTAVTLVACSNDRDILMRIDGDWHHQTLEKDHLEHWLKVLPTPNGFFNAAVSRDWHGDANQPGDIVGQARGIYVMAAGYDLTGKSAYLDQVKLGADFLLRYYSDPLHGGWYEVVGPDGKPKNDNKRLYSQAFAILALANAYRITQDKRYLDAALLTWSLIRLNYADGQGGFRAATNRDFSQTKQGNTQNPIMHLFEALLALYQASASKEAFDGAESIGKFIAYRLLEGLPDGTARIPELYDEKWQPLIGVRGGYIDIGHQFEWAYLLSTASEAGLNPIFAGVADRLINFAIANGFEKGTQGIISSITPEGKINRLRGWWQQAEALRALIHHAALRGRSDLWGKVTQQTDYIRSEFVDTTHGGWYQINKSECRKGGCPHQQPDGYHMAGLHQEALRITKKF